MSKELRKYVADAGLEFDLLTTIEKLQAKRDFEELQLKQSGKYYYYVLLFLISL